MDNKQSIGTIILAAGMGKRMNSTEKNKVTSLLGGKPIILHITDFMKKIGIKTIVIVVGFAKESVIETLNGENIIFAEQKERLGTGHAVESALTELPDYITDVLVVYGDDGVFYNEKQRPIIESLFTKHNESSSACTFLTIEQDDPKGLGRIIRNKTGDVETIIEEKDATDEQKMIKEINPGCFVFSVDFLRKYLPLVEKSPVTGEYYLTSLIDLALKHGEKVETVKGGKMIWRGVNTPEELQKAEELITNN